MHPSRLIDPLVRAFRWHRRAFAAILAAIAVLATLSALSPSSSGTVPVAIATRPLAGGTKLAAADVGVASYPREVVPDGAIADPSALLGRELVAPVSARRPLTSADLLDGGTLVEQGKVAVPVRFSDTDTVAILTVGRRIDILGQRSSQGALTTVTSNVRVVALPGSDGGGLLGRTGGGLVLVEADQTQSAAILAAEAAGTLGYVLR